MQVLERRMNHPHPAKGSYRLAVGVFFFVLGFCFASWASRIPDVQASLGLNDAELGTALFAAPLGQLPTMLAAGFLVSRFGSRAVLTTGLLIYAASLAALGLAASFSHLFAALFLFGVGSNLYGNAVNSQAVGLERIFRRSIMGSLHGLWSLGGVAGGVMGTLLAAGHIPPRTHLTGMAVLALAALLAFRGRVLPRDELGGHGANRRNQTPAEKRFVFPDAFLALLGVMAFGSMATEGAMYDWNAVYFASVIGAPPQFTRLGYIACMAAMVAGRFTMDRLMTRFGPVRLLQVSAACMTLGFALLIGLPHLAPATLGSACIGFGMAAGVPVAFSMAGKTTRVPPSVAISMVNAISFCGFLLCPPVIGHLSHAFSLRAAFLPMAAIALAILGLAPLLRRYHAEPDGSKT